MLTSHQIKALRRQLKLSQKELAHKAGVSLITISNIERGQQKNPRIQTLESISRVFAELGYSASSLALPVDLITQDTAYAHLKQKDEVPTVLIIDDSKTERQLIHTWLREEFGEQDALQIVEADEPKSGVAAYKHAKPDVILLDFMMFGLNGFQFMLELYRTEKQDVPPLVFITNFADPLLEERARAAGAAGFYLKSELSQPRLGQIIRQHLEKLSY